MRLYQTYYLMAVNDMFNIDEKFLILLKFLCLILTFIAFIFEYKYYKNKGKYSIVLGSFLSVSIVITNAPWTSLLSQCILYIVWYLVYKFKPFKLKLGPIFFYIVPIVLFISSYTIGLICLYGIVSFLVLFQIYQIILSILLFSFLFYFIFQLSKSLILKFKTKNSLKYCINNVNDSYFVMFLILPYIALILM